MLQRNTAVLWRELDGEAVLLDPALGCSYNLNRIGTLVWKLLDGGHSRDDIVAAICAAYEVEQAQARQDVDALLADLRQNNLLSEQTTPVHSQDYAQQSQ
ncbi:MAG: PqqD family protein [Chloroflexota bacterium]|nr:PqqD family protein [Chloroflexota bacterium]